MLNSVVRKGMTIVLALATWALVCASTARANPENGKVVLQVCWWDCLNRKYQTDSDGTGGWYTYLAKLRPRPGDMGIDGIWVPAPCKAAHAGTGWVTIFSITTTSGKSFSEEGSFPKQISSDSGKTFFLR